MESEDWRWTRGGCFRACGGGGGLDVWARAQAWQPCTAKKETTYVNTYCSVRGVHSTVCVCRVPTNGGVRRFTFTTSKKGSRVIRAGGRTASWLCRTPEHVLQPRIEGMTWTDRMCKVQPSESHLKKKKSLRDATSPQTRRCNS
jgi:hypothetical protein